MQERHPSTSSSASEASLLGDELGHGVRPHSLSVVTSIKTGSTRARERSARTYARVSLEEGRDTINELQHCYNTIWSRI